MDELDGLFPSRQAAFQLGVFQGLQDFLIPRSGEKSHCVQVVTGKQAAGPHLLHGSFFEKPLNERMRVKIAMAREAIQAMQLEMLVKTRETHKSLERRCAHFEYILEAKMILHQGHNLFRVFIRETQAAADILSDAPTYLDVSIEPDPPVGVRWGRKGGRLPHIMEKNAPGQCRRAPGGQPFEHEAGDPADSPSSMRRV